MQGSALELAHGAFGSACGQGRIGFERRCHLAFARGGGLPAFGILGGAAAGECGFVDREVDAAVGNVDFDQVALLNEADQAAFGGFGGDMADGEAGCAARKAAIGEQGAGRAEAFGFEVACRVEHFLHPRDRRAGLRSG